MATEQAYVNFISSYINKYVILTVSADITKSKCPSIVTPIPTAGPFTKAIIGFSMSINKSMKPLQYKRK